MAERAGLGGGRRQVVVPAQSGRAVSVGCGDLVRVVDVEGHQVGDMWAVDRATLTAGTTSWPPWRRPGLSCRSFPTR